MFNFENFKELIPLITTLIQILIIAIYGIYSIVKKKKNNKNISLLECINEILPTLINQAEEIFKDSKSGAQKRYWVISKIEEITNSKAAGKLAAKKIEEYLSTPQKKGN